MTDTYETINGKPTIKKTLSAALDYSFDWTKWLARVGDSIASYVLTPSAGITLSNQANTANLVSVTVSGGTLGALESLTCRITTSSTPPRVDTRTIYLSIVTR